MIYEYILNLIQKIVIQKPCEILQKIIIYCNKETVFNI